MRNSSRHFNNINVQMRHIRDLVLGRLPFLFYWFMHFMLFPAWILRVLTSKNKKRANKSVCIEAGSAGWLLIEFKELYSTACEYLGSEKAFQICIAREHDYYTQVKTAVTLHRPSHYYFDPRTGSQKWFFALVESIRITVLLTVHGITPIVLLADFGARTHRIQAAILTVFRGAVITFITQSIGRALFPHDRIIAPSLMPFSLSTLNRLDTMENHTKSHNQNKVLFVGSLYEPRTAFLYQLAHSLREKGIELEIKGREPMGARRSDAEYWELLTSYPITVTTNAPEHSMEFPFTPQLTYRYMEAIASGTLLLAPEVPGCQYFLPGQHFVCYSSLQEANEKIEYYIKHKTDRFNIARVGKLRARSLVENKIYWLSIDRVLGKDSLT